MTRYFGTDGVRGIANKELTCEMAFTLGKAAVELLGPRLVLGRDTRRSGPMLEAALVAGITSAGGDALLAGIVPTPTVALLVRELAAAGGVVISASHNAPEYNGIKFFDAEGYKLARELEDAFEARLQGGRVKGTYNSTSPLTPAEPPVGAAVGSSYVVEDAAERYIARAVELMREQGIDLSGLKVAVDCGHGASYHTTPEALRRLGAVVEAINTDFDGNDINVGCGSTHLEQLKELVAKTGAHVGIAHDGDADRMLALDEVGNELDGDVIEAICALDLKARGRLAHDTVVSTVMCNLGFIAAMRDNGIEVVQTAVGDSNVLAAMREGGYSIGGEQSGHMILLEQNSTGDGLATALQLLATMRRSGLSLSKMSTGIAKYPQIIENVKVSNREGFEASEPIRRAVEETTARLGSQGRVLLRPSGTEPLVRVMVEAQDEQTVRLEAKRLAAVVAQELG
ncbi:MAG: phosphoglucosamine mutase [Coriobacteriales bacterium]|jgi:phosphoglucosamine mutase|nr:phosphoglucosamine mutase [Coriobacteriales bacterium]